MYTKISIVKRDIPPICKLTSKNSNKEGHVTKKTQISSTSPLYPTNEIHSKKIVE